MKIISKAALVIAVAAITSAAIADNGGFAAAVPLNSPGKVVPSPVADPNNPNYEVIYISEDGTTVEQTKKGPERFQFEIIGPLGSPYFMNKVTVGQLPLEPPVGATGSAQWSLFHW